MILKDFIIMEIKVKLKRFILLLLLLTVNQFELFSCPIFFDKDGHIKKPSDYSNDQKEALSSLQGKNN